MLRYMYCTCTDVEIHVLMLNIIPIHSRQCMDQIEVLYV